MPTIDQATLTAVKQSRAEIKAKESHRRQLSRNTARKRAALQVTSARREAHVAAIQTRGAEARNALAQREAYRATREQSVRSQARNERISGAVVSTATPSSDSGLFMTVIFTIAGIIVAYILVTNTGTSGWLGTLGDSIHALSSNKPLFTTSPKGT